MANVFNRKLYLPTDYVNVNGIRVAEYPNKNIQYVSV